MKEVIERINLVNTKITLVLCASAVVIGQMVGSWAYKIMLMLGVL